MNYTVETVLGVLNLNYEVIAKSEEGFDTFNLCDFDVKFFGEKPENFRHFYDMHRNVVVASYNIDLDDKLITFHKKI